MFQASKELEDDLDRTFPRWLQMSFRGTVPGIGFGIFVGDGNRLRPIATGDAFGFFSGYGTSIKKSGPATVAFVDGRILKSDGTTVTVIRDGSNGISRMSDSDFFINDAGQVAFTGCINGSAGCGILVGDGVNTTQLTDETTTVSDYTGASMGQLCPCEGPRGQSVGWKNHGQYVACVATTLKSFLQKHLLPLLTVNRRNDEAAQSDCGKK